MKKYDLKAICDQMFSDYPDIVTVKQIQTMLGCSRTFVYKLIEDGEVMALRIGISFKIPKLSVVQYLLSREKDAEPNADSEPIPDEKTQRKRNSTFGEKKTRK